MEYADAEVSAGREETKLQVQQAAGRHRGKLEKWDARMSEVEAQAAEMKARLCVVQDTKTRATSALEGERDRVGEKTHKTCSSCKSVTRFRPHE